MCLQYSKQKIIARSCRINKLARKCAQIIANNDSYTYPLVGLGLRHRFLFITRRVPTFGAPSINQIANQRRISGKAFVKEPIASPVPLGGRQRWGTQPPWPHDVLFTGWNIEDERTQVTGRGDARSVW